MSWSPVSSDDDSSTSGDDNPLTIQDIEKWHSRTAAMNTHSSFNTDTSTLENTVEDEEQNTLTKGGASGETTEGSVGSSPAGSADGGHHHGGNDADNNYVDDNNSRPSRHVVAGLPWTDNEGYEGMYTGEVNDDNVPDGLGLIRYGEGDGEQEGEWRNGTLIRRKGVAKSNVNELSTIEEEKSVKASGTSAAFSSMKYSDEFANFLAAKQIEIEDDDTSLLRRSSSNSMDANTTGENSNARDFADSELYSSTSTRQSALYYASDNSRKGNLYSSANSRRSSLYSSTNSRHLSSSTNSRHLNSSTNSRHEHHHLKPSIITKKSPGESTTFEGSDSGSDHNSFSSGDNFRDSQQALNHHHEDLELVAEEKEEEVAADSSHGSGRSNSDNNIRNDDDDDDQNNEQDQPPSKKKVPHESIDAIQQLMTNDSNIEYDSEESSNGEEHDNDDASALFDWHENDTHKNRRSSAGSFFPGIVEDSDDDEMGPSMGAHPQDGEEGEDIEERRRRFVYCPSFKRSRRWCYLFSACSVISIIGIALISWAIARMRTNNTPNNTNMNVLNSQSKEDDDVGTKISLSWETDAPCAPVTIDIVTDQYGNETSWVLYRLAEVNKETKMSKATRASVTGVGHRKRLRPVASSE
eukprot:scaffold10492_cov147-Skeletonema_menzelii.AAC.2